MFFLRSPATVLPLLLLLMLLLLLLLLLLRQWSVVSMQAVHMIAIPPFRIHILRALREPLAN